MVHGAWFFKIYTTVYSVHIICTLLFEITLSHKRSGGSSAWLTKLYGPLHTPRLDNGRVSAPSTGLDARAEPTHASNWGRDFNSLKIPTLEMSAPLNNVLSCQKLKPHDRCKKTTHKPQGQVKTNTR